MDVIEIIYVDYRPDRKIKRPHLKITRLISKNFIAGEHQPKKWIRWRKKEYIMLRLKHLLLMEEKTRSNINKQESKK